MNIVYSKLRSELIFENCYLLSVKRLQRQKNMYVHTYVYIYVGIYVCNTDAFAATVLLSFSVFI